MGSKTYRRQTKRQQQLSPPGEAKNSAVPAYVESSCTAPFRVGVGVVRSTSLEGRSGRHCCGPLASTLSGPRRTGYVSMTCGTTQVLIGRPAIFSGNTGVSAMQQDQSAKNIVSILFALLLLPAAIDFYLWESIAKLQHEGICVFSVSLCVCVCARSRQKAQQRSDRNNMMSSSMRGEDGERPDNQVKTNKSTADDVVPVL